MDRMLEWHDTSIGLKACNVRDKWMLKLLGTLKHLRYRLRIAAVELTPTMRRGDSWSIRME